MGLDWCIAGVAKSDQAKDIAQRLWELTLFYENVDPFLPSLENDLIASDLPPSPDIRWIYECRPASILQPGETQARVEIIRSDLHEEEPDLVVRTLELAYEDGWDYFVDIEPPFALGRIRAGEREEVDTRIEAEIKRLFEEWSKVALGPEVVLQAPHIGENGAEAYLRANFDDAKVAEILREHHGKVLYQASSEKRGLVPAAYRNFSNDPTMFRGEILKRCEAIPAALKQGFHRFRPAAQLARFVEVMNAHLDSPEGKAMADADRAALRAAIDWHRFWAEADGAISAWF